MGPEANDRLDWELATESIVLKIRWFGVLMGGILIQGRSGLHDPMAVRGFLALGAVYAALDLIEHRRGRVFLRRWPLFVSLMETVFIALLCFHDTRLGSPFRWYYLLSLICSAIRYRRSVAWATCGLHCFSFALLASVLGSGPDVRAAVAEMVAILVCVAWASASLSEVLRATGARLEKVNEALEQNRAELEARVAERSAALRATQARVIHQEKMAAFGLLAAGIAHEVGNPLAGLSSLIQMLRRRDPDPYTATKLELAENQVGRIRRTVRELVDFSRPASIALGRVRTPEIIEEALGIAKYYQRTKGRAITTDIPDDLPPARAVRDHAIQVVLNLVLNAIDATEQGGRIHIKAREQDGQVVIRVEDDGRGVADADRARLFQPYFTTKPRGTGLGLFVSRQIVAEMGGRLDHDDRAERGAAFTVTLPADRAAIAIARPSFAEVAVGPIEVEEGCP